MQHFLAGVEVVFARGIREGGEAAQSRTTRAGLNPSTEIRSIKATAVPERSRATSTGRERR